MNPKPQWIIAIEALSGNIVSGSAADRIAEAYRGDAAKGGPPEPASAKRACDWLAANRSEAAPLVGRYLFTAELASISSVRNGRVMKAKTLAAVACCICDVPELAKESDLLMAPWLAGADDPRPKREPKPPAVVSDMDFSDKLFAEWCNAGIPAKLSEQNQTSIDEWVLIAVQVNELILPAGGAA